MGFLDDIKEYQLKQQQAEFDGWGLPNAPTEYEKTEILACFSEQASHSGAIKGEKRLFVQKNNFLNKWGNPINPNITQKSPYFWADENWQEGEPRNCGWSRIINHEGDLWLMKHPIKIRATEENVWILEDIRDCYIIAKINIVQGNLKDFIKNVSL